MSIGKMAKRNYKGQRPVYGVNGTIELSPEIHTGNKNYN